MFLPTSVAASSRSATPKSCHCIHSPRFQHGRLRLNRYQRQEQEESLRSVASRRSGSRARAGVHSPAFPSEDHSYPMWLTASRTASLHHNPGSSSTHGPSPQPGRGETTSVKWGEVAAEPQEPAGKRDPMPERYPNPAASQQGKRLPAKMPHKPPPRPRAGSQHDPHAFPKAGGFPSRHPNPGWILEGGHQTAPSPAGTKCSPWMLLLGDLLRILPYHQPLCSTVAPSRSRAARFSQGSTTLQPSAAGEGYAVPGPPWEAPAPAPQGSSTRNTHKIFLSCPRPCICTAKAAGLF